jgi:hypothetical protein
MGRIADLVIKIAAVLLAGSCILGADIYIWTHL